MQFDLLMVIDQYRLFFFQSGKFLAIFIAKNNRRLAWHVLRSWMKALSFLPFLLFYGQNLNKL
jgi:hypothetical protein